MDDNYSGLIERYRAYLPVSEKTPVVTLLEGNTALLFAPKLSKHLGLEKKLEIYLKLEGLNPTGSFKDRGMTLAISKALEEGSQAVICASTGNTSASAAAYAARAGIKCVVLIPEGAIALGKLSQAIMHHALVLAIKGNFDQCLQLVREITQKSPITLVNSVNPYRLEGQKTGAFEIVDVLGDAPDFQFIPVGNAGNITAYWKGYREYQAKGKSNKSPKMMGFQAAGAAPIVQGHPVANPRTIASAIRIGNPASWKSAVQARDESGGIIDLVTDDEIVAAYKIVAQLEGVFCEPASAASVAGLIKYTEKGYFKTVEKAKAVCILTGNGLKDPDTAIKVAKPFKKIPAQLEEVLKEIGVN
ncbi:MAG: threonine synthase [Elusimicrobiota bacterium]